MDPGSPLPTLKEQGLCPAGPPATADGLGPALPAPGSIAHPEGREEDSVAGRTEVRGCHLRSPEPRLLHGVWIWKGPLQLPTSEDDPSFPRHPRKLFFLHHSTQQSFYSRLGSESGRCLLCVQLDHFSFRNVLLARDNGTKRSCVGPRTAADGDRLPESSGTSEWPRRLRAE